jgi:hypothetical protein
MAAYFVGSVPYELVLVELVEVCRGRVRVLRGGKETGRWVERGVWDLFVSIQSTLLVSSPLMMMLLRSCRRSRRYRSWRCCKSIQEKVDDRERRLGRRMLRVWFRRRLVLGLMREQRG